MVEWNEEDIMWYPTDFSNAILQGSEAHIFLAQPQPVIKIPTSEISCAHSLHPGTSKPRTSLELIIVHVLLKSCLFDIFSSDDNQF